MNKKILVAFILLIFLSTYNFHKDLNIIFKLNIKEIVIENNQILKEERIKRELAFLYERNLFFLKKIEVEEKLKKINFIDSYEIKKIYPNKIKVKIFEKKPIAIIQNKKEKKFYTNKGELINFINKKEFDNLPLVFGDKESFKEFLYYLKAANFPTNQIKTFYLFESKRWDLITEKDQVIKLPIKNYVQSLINFIKIKDDGNFEKYKIFDYRISDQLILK